jgi:hypothetical protein
MLLIISAASFFVSREATIWRELHLPIAGFGVIQLVPLKTALDVQALGVIGTPTVSDYLNKWT